MPLRRDALCAAAEFILAVEKYARAHTGLVATVGEITAQPGASNVIPGKSNSASMFGMRRIPRAETPAPLSASSCGAGEIRGVSVKWEISHKPRPSLAARR